MDEEGGVEVETSQGEGWSGTGATAAVVTALRRGRHPYPLPVPTERQTPHTQRKAPVPIYYHSHASRERSVKGKKIRTIKALYEHLGYQCCSVHEFAGWVGKRSTEEVYSVAWNLFCSEASLPWCQARRDEGKCMLNENQWNLRQAWAKEAA